MNSGVTYLLYKPLIIPTDLENLFIFITITFPVVMVIKHFLFMFHFNFQNSFLRVYVFLKKNTLNCKVGY